VRRQNHKARDLVLSYAVDETGKFLGLDPMTVDFALGEGFRVRKALHSPFVQGNTPLICVTLILTPPVSTRQLIGGNPGGLVKIPVR
jgi:hypothetical protein